MQQQWGGQLAKAVGAEPSGGDGRWKIAHRCGAKRIYFEVKSVKNWRVWSTVGSGDVAKVDAVVAQSIFSSQHAQNTSCSEHFWKLRGRKSARPCGAKHVWKSKVSKTDGFGAILDHCRLVKTLTWQAGKIPLSIGYDREVDYLIQWGFL